MSVTTHAEATRRSIGPTPGPERLAIVLGPPPCVVLARTQRRTHHLVGRNNRENGGGHPRMERSTSRLGHFRHGTAECSRSAALDPLVRQATPSKLAHEPEPSGLRGSSCTSSNGNRFPPGSEAGAREKCGRAFSPSALLGVRNQCFSSLPQCGHRARQATEDPPCSDRHQPRCRCLQSQGSRLVDEPLPHLNCDNPG
jgi:hypothetical protein